MSAIIRRVHTDHGDMHGVMPSILKELGEARRKLVVNQELHATRTTAWLIWTAA